MAGGRAESTERDRPAGGGGAGSQEPQNSLGEAPSWQMTPCTPFFLVKV